MFKSHRQGWSNILDQSFLVELCIISLFRFAIAFLILTFSFFINKTVFERLQYELANPSNCDSSMSWRTHGKVSAVPPHSKRQHDLVPSLIFLDEIDEGLKKIRWVASHSKGLSTYTRLQLKGHRHWWEIDTHSFLGNFNSMIMRTDKYCYFVDSHGATWPWQRLWRHHRPNFSG